MDDYRITSIKHILPRKKPIDDDESDEYEYRPVTALFTHLSDQIYYIKLDNGETLGVTYQHPIYSVTAGGWKLASELEIGDEVLSKSGETKVVSTNKTEGTETVYNIEVKELHNFLVGNVGVVVHNNYNVLQSVADAAKNIGKAFNADLVSGKNFGKCVDKAKAIRKHLRDNGVAKPKSVRLQLKDENGKLLNNGAIGWDIFDDNGNYVKSYNIASAGFHEYTIINGKIFDNISPSGIELEEFNKRIVPEVGRTFEMIDICD